MGKHSIHHLEFAKFYTEPVLVMEIIYFTFKIAFSFAPNESQITSDKMFYIFNLSKSVFMRTRRRFGLILTMKISNFGKPKNGTADARKGLWWRNSFSACCSCSVTVFPNSTNQISDLLHCQKSREGSKALKVQNHRLTDDDFYSFLLASALNVPLDIKFSSYRHSI